MKDKTVAYSPSTVDEGVFLTKAAEQSEQYDDMLEFIKPLLDKTEELTVDERCLVSVTFKTLCDGKRSAWQVISNLEQNQKYESVKEPIGKYKKFVEDELKSLCKHAIEVIEEKLFNKTVTTEGKVFFLKIKGDYYRYMAEITTGPEFDDNADKALKTYLEAKKVSSEGLLDFLNPVRLGFLLNFSVFFFEIKKNPKEACQIAKAAVDEATSGFQMLEEEQYKDTTYIMQMLKENLIAWTSDVNEGDESPDKADASFA